MYKPTTYNEKRINLLLINSLHHNHDLCCECEEGLFHTTKLLLKQLQKELPENKIQELQKCLTGEENTTNEEEVTFGDDLENIFADDIGEEDAG